MQSVQLTLQAADIGEDIWGSVKGQGVATGRQSRWIRKEELRKQISGEEWDGMMHMELWEDVDTTDGPSALFMTKKMTWKALPSYCHPLLPPQNPKNG